MGRLVRNNLAHPFLANFARTVKSMLASYWAWAKRPIRATNDDEKLYWRHCFLSYSQGKHLLDRKGSNMNIQIFGTKKSFDTKKAQRYFKERRVKFQFVDLKEKGLSKGELESVARAAGGIDALIDPSAKDADTVALVQYLGADQKFDKVLENQQILREPIVRNGRQATVGYQPDVWKGWE